jgi:hypothetical protein
MEVWVSCQRKLSLQFDHRHAYMQNVSYVRHILLPMNLYLSHDSMHVTALRVTVNTYLYTIPDFQSERSRISTRLGSSHLVFSKMRF